VASLDGTIDDGVLVTVTVAPPTVVICSVMYGLDGIELTMCSVATEPLEVWTGTVPMVIGTVSVVVSPFEVMTCGTVMEVATGETTSLEDETNGLEMTGAETV
jgi:hypothetical protein